ncbi:helix-turn-helix domain-containing protein [Brevundimonas pishanensis]|uniref:helix-turn-helix domain-containing protein n=1 Tax=Brevundimonas pishanensis TaxID=2896315 RepID=UPI001FA7BF28|nr:helix-turn-helix transcriptional regulator [Brevundimonas pishanensis]
MADKLDTEIGLRLRRARIAQNLTQKDVAEALRISPQAYQKYETGAVRLSLATLAKLQNVLDLPLGGLLPTLRADGSAIDSPEAAIGSSITGVRLAKAFSRLTTEQQRTLLDVAHAMRPEPSAAA